MPAVVLLGPQRVRPALADAFEALKVKGRVAAVTAGWEEREDEIDELSEHLGRPVRNLKLHRRGEEVFQRDAELFLAVGDYLTRRREVRAAYRMRLGHAIDAVRDVMRAGYGAALKEEETEAAIGAVREVDARHRERMTHLRGEFEAAWKPHEREAVARHREEIGEVLEGAAALALAGGHVGILLDRLRLFGVAEMWDERPVFAWSGGAMVASEDLVLFHDSPPQGAGHAELLDAGLGLCRGVLPLPHARRRLALNDPSRVALLARRFLPLRCIALDEECRLTVSARGKVAVVRARELLPAGAVLDLPAA